MERLYDLFQKAPTLGSLIDPRTVAEDLFALGFDALRGTLDRALKKIETQADPDRAAVGVAAQGIALAASLMAREFTLVATNVPYLGSRQAGRGIAGLPRRCASGGEGRPGDGVRRAVPGVLRDGRIDGARDAAELAVPWLIQGAPRADAAAGDVERGGEARAGAFETISGEVVNVVLS